MFETELKFKDTYYKNYVNKLTISKNSGVHLIKLTPDLNSSTLFFNWVNSQRDLKDIVIVKEFFNKKSLEKEENMMLKCNNIENVVKHLHSYCFSNKSDQKFLLFIEFCEKGSLKDVILKKEAFLKDIYSLSHTITKTVWDLHRNGIYHRDIKPDNIFVTVSNCLKIGDFGLAIDDLNDFSGNCGTKYYMSPEHLKNDQNFITLKKPLLKIGDFSLDLNHLPEKSEFCGSKSEKNLEGLKNESILIEQREIKKLLERRDIFGLGKTIYEVSKGQVYVNFMALDYEQIKIKVLNDMDNLGFKNQFIRIVLDMLEEPEYVSYDLQEYIQFFETLKEGEIVLKDDVKVNQKNPMITKKPIKQSDVKNLPKIIVKSQKVECFKFFKLNEKKYNLSSAKTSLKMLEANISLDRVSISNIPPIKSYSEEEKEISDLKQENIKKTNESYEILKIPNEEIKINELKDFDDFQIKNLNEPLEEKKNNYQPIVINNNFPQNNQIIRKNSPPNNFEFQIKFQAEQNGYSKQNFQKSGRSKIICFKCGEGNSELKIKCKHYCHKACLKQIIDTCARLDEKKFSCLVCFKPIDITDILINKTK